MKEAPAFLIGGSFFIYHGFTFNLLQGVLS